MPMTRESLKDEVLPTTWEDLAPHFARGALIMASPSLDVLDAAVAIANDDTAKVQAWLAAGLLVRPSDADAEAWATSPPRFQIVILQPWVLAQVIPA